MAIPPYPPVPAPSTWADGPVLVSHLRADVTQGVTFLANRPQFLGYDPNGDLLAPDTPAQVVLTDEVTDTWGGHDPLGANPALYYCQAPGWYLAEGFACWNRTSATAAVFTTDLQSVTATGTLTIPGESQTWNSGQNPAPIACDLVQLTRTGTPGSAGADTVSMVVTQGAGFSLSLSAVAKKLPRLAVRWVAALAGMTGLPVPANPAWPVPPAYITPGFLNTSIRDTAQFLAFPPIARMYFNGNNTGFPSQAFPAGTTVQLDSVTVDNYSGWNGTTYTAPVSGLYYCYGQVSFTLTGSATICAAGFSVNSGTTAWRKVFASPAAAPVTIAAVERVRLNAGDTLAFLASQGSGSSADVVAGTSGPTRFIVVWEAA